MRSTSFLFCLPARSGAFLYGLSEALFCATACIRCYVGGAHGLDLISLCIAKVLISLNGFNQDQAAKLRNALQDSITDHIPLQALKLYNTTCLCYCLFVGLAASLGMIGIGARISALVRVYQVADALSIVAAAFLIVLMLPHAGDYAAALAFMAQRSLSEKLTGVWLLRLLSTAEGVEVLLGCVGVLWTLVRAYGLSLVTDSIIEVTKANRGMEKLTEPFLRRHLRRIPE
ncbi:hypothetical protein FOZ60_006550 [Perkinsus olseni]|uniref:Uncharacterized protein n=2 Tax=Perkinsus olseni TaxID=32597 RepID=A0A7J6NNK4_PEROL|nr:hypothetical protein FOZ60_006550 [Perkinsus olseni]